MKIKAIVITMLLCVTLLPGCKKTENQPNQQASPSPTATVTPTGTPKTTTPDATTSASLVKSGDAFVEAISRGGTWIIALLNDLTINKELTVDGEFKNTKQPPVSQRKLAFYAQDDKRNVTAKYTLTAPKMTINSPDCAIWYGTFKGDLYVAAKNFQLIGATVDGNIYFTNDDAKATFKMDDKSKVTGKQEIKK